MLMKISRYILLLQCALFQQLCRAFCSQWMEMTWSWAARHHMLAHGLPALVDQDLG